MLWPWEAFEERLHIREEDKMEDVSIGTLILTEASTGKQRVCYVLSDILEHRRDEVLALVYIKDIKKLRVLTGAMPDGI